MLHSFTTQMRPEETLKLLYITVNERAMRPREVLHFFTTQMRPEETLKLLYNTVNERAE